jgi:SAM-dependent methyltransferase
VPVSQRKRLGAWYTPPALVAEVVAALDLADLVAACGDRPVRVLDPACGDGRFLFAVSDAVSALGGTVELTGVDVDPDAPVFAPAGAGFPCAAGSGAAAGTGAAPATATGTWICADALTRPWRPATFDVVVGNPPFLNQLATATTRGGRSSHGGGPYADAAAEFLALAAVLVAPGGRIGLVLPQSLLSTRDAAAIRADVERRAALRWIWWSPTSVFEAAVRTCATVWEVAGVHRPVRRSVGPSFAPAAAISVRPVAGASWARLITDLAEPAVVPLQPTLGSIASFTVDFRDTYYGLVGCVDDSGDGPPLITSGLIEPGRCVWGERPARFAKCTYAAPRVDLARLSPAMRRWSARRMVPKILVANQTRTIEAVHDRDGAWLPGVPVITCLTAEHERVIECLAGEEALRWVHYHAAGSGLGAGTVRLTPALLASIPLPD